MTELEKIKEMTEGQAHDYIRWVLDKDGVKNRFEMSGYNSERYVCASAYNQGILDRFAHLGIYDYFVFIHIDFYKGGGSIFYKPWGKQYPFMPGQAVVDEVELGGHKTVEIIYEVFKMSILSNAKQRRR